MLTSDRKNYSNIIKQCAVTISLNVSSTLLSLMIQQLGFTEANIVVIYLLSVLITSRYTKGYIYGIVASVISILSFNFFFTIPLYTFKVEDKSYYFTFIVMLTSAVFTSALTSKLLHSKEMTDDREKQAHMLYSLTSSLAKTSEILDVAKVSSKCLSNLLGCDISCILVNDKSFKSQILTVKKGCFEINEEEAGRDDIEIIVKNHHSFPIKFRGRCISYICFPKKMDEMIERNKFLFDSIVMQITIAMEREILIEEKENANTETQNERFKNNLLRSISHDLRTPLTRITGASEMLNHSLNDNESLKLVSEIYEDSRWLTKLVENILSLTRIQEGRLALNIKKEAVEEIVAESIARASKYNPDHKVSINLPDEVLFVPMDGKLIEQVLINLVDNAIKHTTPQNEIIVSIWPEGGKVWFEVYNNGLGINENDLPNLFKMFYIGSNKIPDSRQGMGLGLSICKAIINYHGGEIYAENNEEGGATFKFYLKA
jgi:two-component system sensor histidine kinase KdpD